MRLASDLRPWRLRDVRWADDSQGLILELQLPRARQRVVAWLDPSGHTLTRLSPGLGADARYAGQTGGAKPAVLIAVRQPVGRGFRLQAVTPSGAVLAEWDSPLSAACRWLATGSQAIGAQAVGAQAVAVEVTEGGMQWWHGQLAERSWTRICQLSAQDGHLSRPLAFSADGATLYALSSAGRDTLALVAMSPPEWTPQVVRSDDRFDITWVTMAPDGSGPDLVSTANPECTQTALTTGAAADLAAVRELAAGSWARILGRNPTHCLAEICYPVGGPALVVVSRAGRAGKPLPRYSGFAGARTQPRGPVSYRARDGRSITGYVTRPDGPPPWPAVLAVHDGPWDRDRPQLDPWAQALAAAGICCVQVNYRGSRGFGIRFRNAGDRQWSLAMQDDLVDALQSPELSGLLDRGRIAASGYGYGGYAALMLATQAEVPLAGVVAASAPADLVRYVSGLISAGGPAGIAEAARIGDPVADRGRLAAASPVSRAADIRAPVLLFHGRQDRRVPVSHAADLADALRCAGRTCELVIYEDEGHWYQRTQNISGLRARAIDFLVRNLCPAADPAAP